MHIAAADLRRARTSEPIFFLEEVAERTLEALLDRGVVGSHEFLIVDEVQDIARESIRDDLDLLVDGGLKFGHLLLFGDFERQAISELSKGREMLRYGVDSTFMTYEADCDQSPQVVKAVLALRDEGVDLDEIVLLSVLRSGAKAEMTRAPDRLVTVIESETLRGAIGGGE